VQIARVRARSGLEETQIRAIMAAQASRAERLAAADDVIDNSGSLEYLRLQVEALDRRYREEAARRT
jgi:dephospho-CoA kinase